MEKTFKKALIIYNPVSGWMPSKTLLFDLISRLSTDGYLSVVYMTSKEQPDSKALKEFTQGIDKIICCGGDGTLHNVLNNVLKNNIHIPIGYVPIGTTNDFGNAHQIPRDIQSAYDLIQKNNLQKIDVGRFGKNAFFTYIACFGVFTKLTYGASQPLKNSLGQFAYLIEGTKEIPDLLKGYHMRIETDDASYEGEFVFGAVTNSLNFAGFFSLPVTQDDLRDGYLEAILIRKPENLIELQQIAGSLMTSSYDHEKILFLKVKKIHFIADEPIAWNLDGEFAGDKREVTITVMEKALELINGA